MNPNQIPQNPIREFDELYVKDDKVLQADSEQIANEFFKERDDKNFKKELELLTVELQQLDEGKFFPLITSTITLASSDSIPEQNHHQVTIIIIIEKKRINSKDSLITLFLLLLLFCCLLTHTL